MVYLHSEIEIQGGIHRLVMDHDVHDFASTDAHHLVLLVVWLSLI